MKHDTAKLAASYESYRKHYDAALADLNSKIDKLTAERDALSKSIYSRHKTFADGLIFSASARCKCGAGLCYKQGTEADAWVCSADVTHPSYPFAFYEIKSEDQPSAMGQTTRSDPVEIL